MPINADAKFFLRKVDYENAKTPKEKIQALEAMISAAPTHKGAEKLRAQLKKKLSDLKKEAGKKRGPTKSGGPGGFSIKKEGDAMVCIIGKPNSGKSTLLSRLTNARPKIAPYAYTTKAPEVGSMKYSMVDILTVDLPAITEGTYLSERGGPIYGIIRNSDAIILVVDATKAKEDITELFDELELAGIEKKPIIVIMNSIVKKNNAELLLKSQISGIISERKIPVMLNDLNRPDLNIEVIKEKVWTVLRKIRVYTKAGNRMDDHPMVLPAESTVRDLTKVIHKDLLLSFRFARVWRKNSHHSGQRVGLDFVLKDEDTVEVFG